MDTTEKISLTVNDVHEVLFAGPNDSKQAKKKDAIPYNKALLHRYQQDAPGSYRKFYYYLFELVRQE